MSDNHSQLGHVPSESFVEINHSDTNIDQLLTFDVLTADPSSSKVAPTTAIEVTGTGRVPNNVFHNTPTTRQLARQRQCQRRRQRQRDRQQEIAHLQRQRHRQNWIPRSPPPNRPRRAYVREHRMPRRVEEVLWNLSDNRDRMSQSSHSPTDKTLLDTYDLAHIDPRENMGTRTIVWIRRVLSFLNTSDYWPMRWNNRRIPKPKSN